MTEPIHVGDIVERLAVGFPGERKMIYEVVEILPETADRRHTSGPLKNRNMDLFKLNLVFADPPLESSRFRGEEPDWATFPSADVFEGLVKVPAMLVLAIMHDAGPPVIKRPCPKWCWRDHDHGWPQPHLID
jgi:hypothetical protein